MRRILQIADTARNFFLPRRHTEHEPDALLRAIYDSSPIGITLTDLQGRFVRTNPAFQAMTGFTETELRAETCESLTHPDDFPQYQVLLKELLAGQSTAFKLILRHRKKGGAAVWIRSTVSKLKENYAAPRYLVTHSEDITESGLHQKRRREHAETLHLLMASVTGYALFAPGQAVAFSADDRDVPARGTPLECEETTHDTEGLCIGMAGKFPVRDAAGRIFGIGGIATDITEYKRTQEARWAREQGFRELVDILPIAVYTCNSAGLIVSHNRQAIELWGRVPRLGDGADRFCGAYRLYTSEGVPLPRPECPMGEVLRTGRAVTDHEMVIERPDGSRRTVVVNIIPRRDEYGSLTGAINCLMDITERKRAEHDLKEYTEQLRILSNRLVELHEESRLTLSRELHDRVGQNLSALNINLSIVLGQLPDVAKDLVGMRLKDSQELVEATVDVITDVMADLRPPLLDDYGLLPALKSIAEQFGQRTGIDVGVRGPSYLDGLPKQVEISLCRIVQEALTNLAKHARAENVKIEVALMPDQITLTISDDGIGFDSGTYMQHNGRTGWGMLTMRERAVALGGTLMIDSEPGLGTRVTVTLQR